MDPIRIPYAATQRFSPLVLDHLVGAEEVRELVQWSPDLEGARLAAKSRTFDAATRAVLCDALERQYAGLEVGEVVRMSLTLLRRPDALTVTTGHQLCLFGGPLYVPFKILNTIRVARTLSDDLGRPVLPVFWMATEDHDRPEVDHAWMAGTRVHWPGNIGGAVGHLPLTDSAAAVEQASSLLGTGADAEEMRSLMRSCYRPDRSLAAATRCFVHGLYGRFGLLVLDGDDPALKRLFAPLMREELLNQVTRRTVEYANAKLEGRYAVQAHVRDINLFHMRPGHRSRMELNGEHYAVLNGGPVLTLDQALAAVEEHPAQFSPNVLMRPLYQETILPNVAYIGGGGELAYWLQLRWSFQAFQLPMPVLLLRNSAAFISTKHMAQWRSMGLSPEDLFAPLAHVQSNVAAREAGFSVDLDAERNSMNALYDGLLERAMAVDATLHGAVEARRKAALAGLQRVEKGLLRAAKRAQEVPLQRMERIHQALFPGEGLQERRDNILPMLVARGPQFLDELMDMLDPFDARFTLLVDA